MCYPEAIVNDFFRNIKPTVKNKQKLQGKNSEMILYKANITGVYYNHVKVNDYLKNGENNKFD